MKYWDYNNFDVNDVLRDLASNDFNTIDPNKILSLIHENILSLLSSHAKTKTKPSESKSN